jgi:hypothetical protein
MRRAQLQAVRFSLESTRSAALEQHVLWLTTDQVVVDVLREAGFDMKAEPNELDPDRSLLTGRRRSP